MNETYQIPIVLIVFNRPEQTKQVIDRIREIKPKKLFLVGDGARDGRALEKVLVEEVRQLVRGIDWDCSIQENFSEINLGCKKRIQSGLDWVFSQTDMAVVLEDDCLPDLSFFAFVEEMLNRYKDDSRVGMVSGNNFHYGKYKTRTSYYFSRYPHIWGWATWARAWQLNEPNIESWPRVRESSLLRELIRSPTERRGWEASFDNIHNVDTWDVQWVYSLWANRMLSIAPAVNLVTNIGFGEGATHTTVADFTSNVPVKALPLPLRHPRRIKVNKIADRAEIWMTRVNLAIGFAKRGFRFASQK